MEDKELQEIKERAEGLLKISNLKESDGGKEMVKVLMADKMSIVDNLTSKYRTASQTELIAYIAKIEAIDDLLRELNTAEYRYQELKAEYEDKEA